MSDGRNHKIYYSRKASINLQKYVFYEKNYYQTHPYNAYKFYEGYKIVIDESKEERLPVSLWDITRFLPDDIRYYTKMFAKNAGKNPGWFCLIHLEYILKNGDRNIIPQWVLCKKSEVAQDISEILMQSILNELIGNDICASPAICVDKETKETFVLSIIYPGFQDSWKRFFTNHNAYLLQMGHEPKPRPTERPKSVGILNRFIQNGIGKPTPSIPECVPYFKDFYLCMALSFFIRNFDFHFSNVGSIFRDENGAIVKDSRIINQLSTYIQKQDACIMQKDFKAYKKISKAFRDAKKSMKIEECLVLIDCGWAGAHWEKHIANTLLGNIGFESNDIKLHLPLIEPTNHFNDLARSIKYTEAFADTLLWVCNKFNNENLIKLKPFLHETLQYMENYYGEKGLCDYANFLGIKFKNKKKIKEIILNYLIFRAFPTEIIAARQLAFMIKVSLCFQEKGKWTKTGEGYQWTGTHEFQYNSTKFKKLITDYHDDASQLLNKTTAKYFVGEGQEPSQKNLLRRYKKKLHKHHQQNHSIELYNVKFFPNPCKTSSHNDQKDWIFHPRH